MTKNAGVQGETNDAEAYTNQGTTKGDLVDYKGRADRENKICGCCGKPTVDYREYGRGRWSDHKLKTPICFGCSETIAKSKKGDNETKAGKEIRKMNAIGYSTDWLDDPTKIGDSNFI
ncbi:MAG: hypothetical protein A2W23_04525 [Planctomycetes bacterium RBG_16_43_13]|nr:MAG: hypothetical protein A2W23_04525 [Planctomycetes bacterium RBG_16_43_13]